jgi:protein-S-isoprenylcysteine O-methyltransferase Ste14
MYPVLVIVYTRLARQEEQLVRNEFGEAYDNYIRKVPAFIPKLTSHPEAVCYKEVKS